MSKKPKIIVYDNGGKTFDRYTACVLNDENGLYDVRSMSENASSPQGVNQYAGEMTLEQVEALDCGKRLRHVPEGILRAWAQEKEDEP